MHEGEERHHEEEAVVICRGPAMPPLEQLDERHQRAVGRELYELRRQPPLDKLCREGGVADAGSLPLQPRHLCELRLRVILLVAEALRRLEILQLGDGLGADAATG